MMDNLNVYMQIKEYKYNVRTCARKNTIRLLLRNIQCVNQFALVITKMFEALLVINQINQQNYLLAFV